MTETATPPGVRRRCLALLPILMLLSQAAAAPHDKLCGTNYCSWQLALQRSH